MPRAMKDSGIDWLGQIPADWLCRKLKTILVANDGGIWGNDPVGNESDKVVIRSTEQTVDGKWSIDKPATRNLSSIDYSKARIEKDDLLITKSSGSDLHIGKTTLADDYFINHECYFSNFLQRIRCSGYSPKLLWYLFNSPIIRAQCVYLQNSTSGLGNINADIIGNLYIPVPPLDEQQRIANFLDDECARIDSIVENTRASIEEYKKLKQAIITRAVTKGIRPNRPMKDSGIEWIGDIPSDWEIVPINHLCSYNDEVLPENTVPDFIFDYIEIGSVEFGKGIIEMQRVRFADAPSRARRIVHENDIIVSTVRTYLKAVASIPRSDIPLIASTGFVVIRPRDVNPIFLRYAILSNTTISMIESNSVGISYPAINASQVVRFKIPVPSLDEQEEIAHSLDEKTAAIDSLIAKKGRLVTELESLKKSLIFEYATGKKEVPT